jgi:hypothetical protein
MSCVKADAQTVINRTSSTSCSFKAPTGLSSNQVVLFPASEKQTLTPAATSAVTVKQFITILDYSATAMTAAMTINLTIHSQVTRGALLQVVTKSDGTARTVTWGTGFTMATGLAGQASKTKVMNFIYNGTTFIPIDSGIQID